MGCKTEADDERHLPGLLTETKQRARGSHLAQTVNSESKAWL
jgi:hypothetical protein